jgi:predicted metal-dependent phosphoesterase TrpH
MRYADLHVHTTFSDGTFSPAEAIRYAKSVGLSCVAICDHDSTSGIAPAIEEGKRQSIEVVPAVELTVIMRGKELHVLGYFVLWKEKWFGEILKTIQRKRVIRMHKMLANLKKIGIDLDEKKVMSIAGEGSVSRLHLARAMLEAGVISSLGEAFWKYIGDDKPCYEKDIGFGPKKSIDFILKAGGVPVWAHPHGVGRDEFLPELVEYGLRGLEVYHSDHTPQVVSKYKRLATEYGLLVTGGSDCHGLAKKKILMGSIKMPYEIVEELKNERKSA